MHFQVCVKIFASSLVGCQFMDSNTIIVVYYLVSRKQYQQLVANFKRSRMANHA